MVRASTKESNPAGGGLIPAGRYHFSIEEAKEVVNGDRVNVEVHVTALAGTNPAGVGSTYKDFFPVVGKAVDRLFSLAVATGVLSKDTWNAAKQADADIEVNETEMIGRTFCGEIQLKEYKGQNAEHQGKHFPSLDFRIWSPTDPKAADIPKDPAVMKSLGVAAPAATPVAAAANGDGWGDL